MPGPNVPWGELSKRRNVILFALVLVVILVTAGISACKQPESENTQIREVWVKAPNGNKLYSHIHEPANASVENQYPGLALVPGGSGPGTVFDNGQADDIANKGFVVIHFDPEGRGRSWDDSAYGPSLPEST